MDSKSTMLKKKKSPPCKEDESSGAMVVAVRIRPLSTKEINAGLKSCCTAINGNTIAIKKDGNAAMYLKSQLGSVNEYCFDSVFDTSNTQYDVYEKTAKRFIADVIDGYNVTVFAYGATGAGKTHTMMGNTRVDESQGDTAEAGIIPNALSDIFKIISERRATAQPGESWSVIVSFMEVYNEQVYDLLEATDKILSVREDTERGVVEVAGRTKKVVESAEDVLLLLQLGNTNRKTEATMANQVSSRSHAVLQLAVEANYRNASGQKTSTTSTLSMIDLAGSERASATNNRGTRLQEGANINKSLLALANCINALAGNSASGKQLNVKYRDSKLTHLLKSSLQGKCKLVMIANINPSHITFEDSHNSLKYANRAKNIKVNPMIASELSKESNWVEREIELKAENAELRARVAELEATVASLQSINALLPDDYYLHDDVVDCSLDCSQLNASSMSCAADRSLPAIGTPALKPSKTPQHKHQQPLKSSSSAAAARRTTPHSDRQRRRCDESRDELVDFVEANCSLANANANANSSFNVDNEVENVIINVVNSRRKSIENFSKKRHVTDHSTSSSSEISGDSSSSQQLQRDPPSKKVRLEPMTSSLKDRIAELSKITFEQQKMFDDLLHDQGFMDHMEDPDEEAQSCSSVRVPEAEEDGDVDRGRSRSVLREETQDMRSVVSLVDIAAKDTPCVPEAAAPTLSSSSMPFIFCDEDTQEQEQEQEQAEPVPRKRRRNSLIPKKSSDTDKKPLAEQQPPAPLTRRSSNAAANNSDRSASVDKGEGQGQGGLFSKVLKGVLPVTRAAMRKKRLSVAGDCENQPPPVLFTQQQQQEAGGAGAALKPLRPSARRSSVSSTRVLRNL